ncbi:MAG: glycosyltransferase, partial [bacterium]|nr:glycosyltransferase [bacterium]
MPKTSIIIPAYNIEKYIKTTLESLLNQPFKDIEILCVDDCSTDNTCKIIEEIKDERIKLIKREKNQGAGSARNTALNLARGEYIAFVDGDDNIKENIFLECEKYFEKNPDLIIFGAETFYANKNKTKKGQYSYKKFPSKFSLDKIYKYHTISMNKLYKKEFLKENNITFSTSKTGEDQILFLKSMLLAKNIEIIKKDLYLYTKNRNGSLTNKAIKKDLSPIENFYIIEEFISSLKIDERLKTHYLTNYVLKTLSWYCKTNESYKKTYFENLEKMFAFLKSKQYKAWWNSYEIKPKMTY